LEREQHGVRGVAVPLGAVLQNGGDVHLTSFTLPLINLGCSHGSKLFCRNPPTRNDLCAKPN
jgi:hypothetical protein